MSTTSKKLNWADETEAEAIAKGATEPPTKSAKIKTPKAKIAKQAVPESHGRKLRPDQMDLRSLADVNPFGVLAELGSDNE